MSKIHKQNSSYGRIGEKENTYENLLCDIISLIGYYLNVNYYEGCVYETIRNHIDEAIANIRYDLEDMNE